MYLALLRKLMSGPEGNPSDELDRHATDYLERNAPRTVGLLQDEQLFRRATGIQESDRFTCGPELVQPEVAADDKAAKAAQEIDKKKFAALETAINHVLNTRNFNAANMLTTHLSGYWQGHIQPDRLYNLDRNKLEFLCEHHPEKAAMKANILDAIKSDPREYFSNLLKKGTHGTPVMAYLIKTYGEEILDILRLPNVANIYRLLPDFNPAMDKSRWQKLTHDYPLDLLHNALADKEGYRNFERQLLQGAAMVGAMPILQVFADAMKDTAFSDRPENQKLLLNMMDRAWLGGSLEALQFLKTIPHKKIKSKYEDYATVIALDYIDHPETLPQLWGNADHYAKRLDIAEAIVRSTKSEAVSALAEHLPELLTEVLRTYGSARNIFWKIETDKGESGGIKGIRRVINCLKPEDLDAMLDGILVEHNLHKQKMSVTECDTLMVAWPKLDDEQKERALRCVSPEMKDFLERKHTDLQKDYAVEIMRHEDTVNVRRRWEMYYEHTDALKDLPPAVFQYSPYGFNRKVFDELLEPMKQAVSIEGTGNAVEMAYKLTVLFQTVPRADSYLKRFKGQLNAQAVHDALLFKLPSSGTWDISTWNQIAMSDGEGLSATINGVPYKLKGLSLVGLASKIEADFCREHPGGRNKQLNALRKLSIQEMYDFARKHGYERSNENPDLANFCISIGADEEEFKLTMDTLANAAKKRNTPDIAIDGKNIGLEGFRLRTVASTDPMNLWIGKMGVTCCNHIGGDTQPNAIAQCTSQNVALYVIEKKINKKEWVPVGKVTGWLGQKGDKLVFNSWERVGQIYDRLMEPFLLAAGIAAIQQKNDLKEVRVGRDRGLSGFAESPDIEQPSDTTLRWYDAGQDMPGHAHGQQHTVATREKLQGAEDRLAEIVGNLKEEKQPHTLKLQVPTQYTSSRSRAG